MSKFKVTKSINPMDGFDYDGLCECGFTTPAELVGNTIWLNCGECGTEVTFDPSGVK
jgi:hypothetical protein